MRFRNTFLTLILITSCLLCACGNEGNSEQESKDKAETRTNVTEATEGETAVQPTLASMRTSINMNYLNSDGAYETIPDRHADIVDGVNRYKLFTSLEALETGDEKDWENLEIKIFVINNGSFMDFSLDGEDYAKAHELNARNGDYIEQEIMLRSEDIKYSHGYITVYCMYNPSITPRSGLDAFSGGIVYSFEYDNAGGEGYAFSPSELGEYMDIPENMTEDAFGTDIGYRQKEGAYLLNFNHAYNDVAVSGDDRLYLKVNLGESVSGNFFVAVVCDGEIIILDGENAFIGFEMDNGSKMFQCEIPTAQAESGLHYYQLLILQQNPDNAMELYRELSYRYRVVIED